MGFFKREEELDMVQQERKNDAYYAQQQNQNSSYYPEARHDTYQISYDKEKVALFMAKVMGWMCLGLFLTLVSAVVCLASTPILYLIITNRSFSTGVLVLQLILVFVFSFGLQKMSSGAAKVVFLLYSAATGVTLSVLALIFHLDSIIIVFGLTAGIFLLMSLYGYNTKKDLTGVGSLCLFGLIGIIAASITNQLVYGSVGLNLAILCIGIVLFIALIAYDSQKIKDTYVMALTSGEDEGGEIVKKLSILGALTLYLDFINLFLRLLSIFGRRRN